MHLRLIPWLLRAPLGWRGSHCKPLGPETAWSGEKATAGHSPYGGLGDLPEHFAGINDQAAPAAGSQGRGLRWTDLTHWPKRRNLSTFKEWFNIEFHSLILGLVDLPLEYE